MSRQVDSQRASYIKIQEKLFSGLHSQDVIVKSIDDFGRHELWLNCNFQHLFYFFDDWRPSSTYQNDIMVLTGYHRNDSERHPFTFFVAKSTDEYYGKPNYSLVHSVTGITEYQGCIWMVKITMHQYAPNQDKFLIFPYSPISGESIYLNDDAIHEYWIDSDCHIPTFTHQSLFRVNAYMNPELLCEKISNVNFLRDFESSHGNRIHYVHGKIMKKQVRNACIRIDFQDQQNNKLFVFPKGKIVSRKTAK